MKITYEQVKGYELLGMSPILISNDPDTHHDALQIQLIDGRWAYILEGKPNNVYLSKYHIKGFIHTNREFSLRKP